MFSSVRFRRATAVAAIVLSAAAGVGAQTAESGKRYALLVGVQTYNPSSGFNNLRYAEDDALELADTLEQIGYSVLTMTRRADIPDFRPSTAEKILTQLRRLLNGLAPDDTILLCFSGHG